MDASDERTEKDILLRYLSAQRNHVLEILDGLSDADLHRPALPSRWTALGLLQHLALDVERFWFRAVIAGEQNVIDGLSDDNAWAVAADAAAEEIIGLYRSEIERANGVIARTTLGRAPAWWPDFFGDFRLSDLRDVMLHVIVETACHAGHADALRELIDGRQRLVLTE